MWPLLHILILLPSFIQGSKRLSDKAIDIEQPDAKRPKVETNQKTSGEHGSTLIQFCESIKTHVSDKDSDSSFISQEGKTDGEVDVDALNNIERLEYIKTVRMAALEKGSSPGHIFYLCSNEWYKEWKRFCRSEAAKDPASTFRPVDTDSIIDWDRYNELPDHHVPTRSGVSFRVLHETEWNLLQNWYGTNARCIKRRMYEYPEKGMNYGKHLAHIELFYGDNTLSEIINVDCLDTIKTVKGLIRKYISNLKPKLTLPETLCYSYKPPYSSEAYALDETLDEHCVFELDLEEDDYYIYVTDHPSGLAFPPYSKSNEELIHRNEAGLVGLLNIGNTCYMNSALQCLFHCVALRDLVLSTEIGDEINAASKNITKQALLSQFRSLMWKAWTAPPNSVLDTAAFKFWSDFFAPQFMDFEQYDSQEFLAVLLQNLCPELKLSVEKISASPFNDPFNGEFKSRLTCHTCHQSSTTVDPFMFLSLPIPTGEALSLSVLIQSDSQVGEVELFFDAKSKKTISCLKQAVLNRLALSSNDYEVHLIESSCNAQWNSLNGTDDRPLSDYSQKFLQAGIVVRGTKHRWMQFIVHGSPIGFPLLVPTQNLPFGQTLVEFSRNPELQVENFQSLEMINNMILIAIDNAVYSKYVREASELFSQDRPQRAFQNMFLSRHEVLTQQDAPQEMTNTKINLDLCLQNFLEEEVLDEAESWHCPHCDRKSAETKKKLDIAKPPEVLFVHLKRFSFGKKLDTPVEFPIEYRFEYFP